MNSGKVELIPSDVDLLLQESIAKLENGSSVTLSFARRSRILRSLGPSVRKADGFAAINTGLKRRTSVAILSAKYVAAKWSAAYPEDPLPNQIMATSRQYVDGGATQPALWDLANAFWARSEVLRSQGAPAAAVYAGCAAAKTASVAFRDEDLGDDGQADGVADREGEFLDWDSALFASLAHCEEDLLPLAESDQLRREFWLWYLKRAVPAAFEIYPPTGIDFRSRRP